MGLPVAGQRVWEAWTQASRDSADLESRFGVFSVTVKDAAFAGGAKGDFVADDTASIQAALTAVALAGGGDVIVPRGTYKITAPLVMGSFTRIRGTGVKSILKAATAQIVVLNAAAQSFCVVQDLALDGNALGSIGVQFTTCPNSLVKGCRITGFTQLQVGTAYGGGVHMYLSDECTVEDCDFSGNGVLVGGLTSDIQINGNGIVADCTKRVRIHNNRCLSVAVQTNIVAYDVAYSIVSENECSGAKTQASNNNGYGIILYRTVNANVGTARRNRVCDNLVYAVGGTAVYIQGQDDCACVGNVCEDWGAVQDDTTLVVAAIGYSGSPRGTITGNVGYNGSKAGVALGAIGFCYGYTVSGNSMNNIAGFGYYLRADVKRSTFTGNTSKDCFGGFASPPVDQSIEGCTFAGNTVNGTTNGYGFILYGCARSTFVGNMVYGSYRSGFALSGASPGNTFIGNEAWDGSVVGDNTYHGFEFAGCTDTTLIGNTAGNTGVVGYKWCFFVGSTCNRSMVTGNRASGGRTANYNVDNTVFAAQIGFWGNFDAALANPQIFAMRQQAVLQGAANNMVQLLLGDSSSICSIGTRWASADPYVAGNAVHLQGSDLWHQPVAGTASKLMLLKVNGDWEFYSAAAGTGDGTFAAFWGAAKGAITATSTVKLAGTQVLKIQQAAVADIASANASDLATVITLANETKTEVNLLLNRVRAATGHGLIA